MSYLISALLVVIVLLSSELKSQSVYTKVSGMALENSRDSLSVSFIRGTDTIKGGWIIDQLLIKGDTLCRTYSVRDSLTGDRTDTLVQLRTNLAPISYKSRSRSRGISVRYEKGKVVVNSFRIIDDTVVAMLQSPGFERELGPSVFDGGALDLFLRSSNLSVNDTLRASFYIPLLKREEAITSVVEGLDSINVKSLGKREAWRVSSDFAGMQVVFWIDVKNRKLLRQRMSFPNGYLWIQAD